MFKACEVFNEPQRVPFIHGSSILARASNGGGGLRARERAAIGVIRRRRSSVEEEVRTASTTAASAEIRCLLSLERKKFCQEGHIRGVFRPVYRFQLHLADGSMEGRAFKATVFNSAAVPLGRSASELRALPFSLQEQIVTECCQKRERFLVSIRTGRGKPVVEDMTRVDDPSAVEIGRGGFKQIVDCVMHMFGLLTLKRAER
ncbi:hypothetical protein R1sor_017933 [Riccia sorocarpa]|uniref:Uncharacterized protein n=1 Tax=Riccia sorocarpa TaxID=122646 RepID=A0ABD3IC89_9MARC